MGNIKAGQHLIDAFSTLLGELRTATGASRCTVRLDLPLYGLSVNTPCSETHEPTVPSMLQDGSMDHRRAKSIRWIERTRRTLVQTDTLSDPSIAPPAALAMHYKIHAQMVGPLIGDDDYLVGWMSAHFAQRQQAFNKEQRKVFETIRQAVNVLVNRDAEKAHG